MPLTVAVWEERKSLLEDLGLLLMKSCWALIYPVDIWIWSWIKLLLYNAILSFLTIGVTRGSSRKALTSVAQGIGERGIQADLRELLLS